MACLVVCDLRGSSLPLDLVLICSFDDIWLCIHVMQASARVEDQESMVFRQCQSTTAHKDCLTPTATSASPTPEERRIERPV